MSYRKVLGGYLVIFISVDDWMDTDMNASLQSTVRKETGLSRLNDCKKKSGINHQ